MTSKVVFVNRYFYPDCSATSQVLTDLCLGLSAYGIPVVVLAGRYRYDDSMANTSLSPKEIKSGVSICRCWSSHFGRNRLFGRALDYLTFCFAVNVRLFSVIRRGDVVVAMTDPPMLGVSLMPVVKIRRAKLVNWFQDIFPELAEELGIRMISRGVGRALRYLRNKSCHSAVMNVAIGYRMSEYLKSSEGFSGSITVISNWAPVGIMPTLSNENPLREKWGLSGYFVVGYSGNLGRAHDWKTILEAICLLADNGRIHFLMIGGGAGMDALQQQVVIRGLNNVSFLPYQPREQLSHSLSASDLHLVSLQAGVSDYLVPSKIYGIAAVGRPVIFVGPENTEVSDLLSEYAFGETVSNGDARQLATSIIGFMDSGFKYREACVNALGAHDAEFAMPLALKAWSQLLAEHGIEPHSV